MKKVLSLLMAATLSLALFGCQPKPAASEAPKEEASATPAKTVIDPKEAKVAILLPSAPTDGGWGQVGAEAMKSIESKFGCKTTVIEASTADKMTSEAEALADAGYSIIYGHGGQYANPFAEISKDYPNTLFITSGGAVVTENQYPIQITLEDAVYIQGVIAAKLTKTNKIGGIIGGDFPAYTKTTRALDMGAKSINPNMEVVVGILANADMNEAYETAISQINSGCDVIMGNANQASLGALKACKEKGVYYMGTITDLSAEAPDVVVSSATTDFGVAYSEVARRYFDGEIVSGVQELGFETGAMAFSWNEALKSKLPAEVQGAYEEYVDKMISNEIDLPSENEGW